MKFMLTMKNEIKKVTKETIDVFSDILKEAAEWMISKEFMNWDPTQFTVEAVLRDCDINELYLCYINDEPAGCLRLQNEDEMFWPDKPAGDALYIHKLAVRRRFAGMGVSKVMIDWVKNHAADKGVPYVRLDCIANRKKLCKIYMNQGFKQVDERQVFGDSPTARFEYRVNK